ncbi:ATP-binding protein, partial [Streptomyces sp. NPDC049577]
MNYAIRHPDGKVVPRGGPRLVRPRRWLSGGSGAVARCVRRFRVRLAARTKVAPPRRWWAKVSVTTFFQRLSFAAVLVVGAWVGSALYAVFESTKSPLQQWCSQTGSGCADLYGFLAPFLSIGMATALFLVVQSFAVWRPLSRRARKDPRSLVPTAGPAVENVVGRREMCRIIARGLRDRRIRRPYLLVGGVGTGKTSVLVELTRTLARKGAVPVPIRLRDVDLDDPRLDFGDMAMKRFCDEVDRGVLSSRQSERVWRQLCMDDKAVILADGLEETFAEGEKQKQRDIQIRHAIRRAERQHIPLVIASRPHAPLEGTDAAIIDLEPLSEEAALEYLQGSHGGTDGHRMDWIVETAAVSESPLYLQITRELRDHHLLEHPSGPKRSTELDTRSADRAGLQLRLLETWRRALAQGRIHGEVALDERSREATIEVLSALAGIGLLRDRLEVAFDDLIGPDRQDDDAATTGGGKPGPVPGPPFPEIWRGLADRLRDCPEQADTHRCRTFLSLCATHGERLGLVEARGERVRFPHSIVQAYLGSRYVHIARHARLGGALREPGPGRELLIALVLNSRAAPRDPGRREVVDLLLGEAARRTDAKALDLYAAALDIDRITGAAGHMK